MLEPSHRTRLETKCLVVGYAMSRLDKQYLAQQKATSWNKAFQQAAEALQVPPASIKNLRDEFDPFHPDNGRQGWHKRPLRQSRQRVLDELNEVSDDALQELVRRILVYDEAATKEAIDSLGVTTYRAHNVAERLLTGRRAEEYFLKYSQRLLDISPSLLLDLRQGALGFDFGVKNNPDRAIEIKGMKTKKGEILFTDREWTEAKRRQDNYCLVVIGNLAAKPAAGIFINPFSTLTARCTYQSSITASWRSSITV